MRVVISDKLLIFALIFLLYPIVFLKAENADIIVALDGSGDFTSIQNAVNSIPKDNSELKIILIKNGIYHEEIRIDADFIALVGENRDSTRIEYYKPYNWDSVYTDVGRAVVNIYADDITLANLTVENTQPEVKIHAFTVYGENNTRTIIINCNILSNGGDTLSLWNGESGMYYHHTMNLKGAVDFLCPRGWCYAENIKFYCTRKTTPLWHDGSKNKNQKFVIKNSFFDGAMEFRLGRNHLDGAFYMINLNFSEKLIDQPFYLPESAPGPYKWGRRCYFNNCHRQGGDYNWFKDNLTTADESLTPDQVTAKWTFSTAENPWDPESNMPSVLPMAFLPKPAENNKDISLDPRLTWVAGRNANSHKIYFGLDQSPDYVKETTEQCYSPENLKPNSTYYWRVDEVTDVSIIKGDLWKFRTKNDH